MESHVAGAGGSPPFESWPTSDQVYPAAGQPICSGGPLGSAVRPRIRQTGAQLRAQFAAQLTAQGLGRHPHHDGRGDRPAAGRPRRPLRPVRDTGEPDPLRHGQRVPAAAAILRRQSHRPAKSVLSLALRGRNQPLRPAAGTPRRRRDQAGLAGDGNLQSARFSNSCTPTDLSQYFWVGPTVVPSLGPQWLIAQPGWSSGWPASTSSRRRPPTRNSSGRPGSTFRTTRFVPAATTSRCRRSEPRFAAGVDSERLELLRRQRESSAEQPGRACPVPSRKSDIGPGQLLQHRLFRSSNSGRPAAHRSVPRRSLRRRRRSGHRQPQRGHPSKLGANVWANYFSGRHGLGPPGTPPTGPSTSVGSTLLANTTMETYLQNPTSNCFTCHQSAPSGTQPADFNLDFVHSLARATQPGPNPCPVQFPGCIPSMTVRKSAAPKN